MWLAACRARADWRAPACRGTSWSYRGRALLGRRCIAALCQAVRAASLLTVDVPVAERCSPPSGCGVRSTSTTSSCRSPSTAPGPRGTRTSTTARGKQLSCHSDFGAHWRCRLYKRARWPNKRSAAEEAGCCKHKIPKKKHNNTRSALVRCAWFDSTRSRLVLSCHTARIGRPVVRAHPTPPQAGSIKCRARVPRLALTPPAEWTCCSRQCGTRYLWTVQCGESPNT